MYPAKADIFFNQNYYQVPKLKACIHIKQELKTRDVCCDLTLSNTLSQNAKPNHNKFVSGESVKLICNYYF